MSAQREQHCSTANEGQCLLENHREEEQEELQQPSILDGKCLTVVH